MTNNGDAGTPVEIRTRYWSDHHGAGKITASARVGGRAFQQTIGYDHALGSGGSHYAAAEKLAARKGWTLRSPDPIRISNGEQHFVARASLCDRSPLLLS